MRILIADRSTENRATLVDAFKIVSSAVRVAEVDNGVDCFEKLKRNEYDLAFVDVDMPRIGGMEILALANQKGFRTYIVVMSVELKADIIQAVKRLKAYDFLPKPFSLRTAQRIIEKFQKMNKRLSVIIADDNPGARKVVSKILSQSVFNLRLDEASGGEDALQWSSSRHYDLAILDWNMPKLNGIQTLEKLRITNPKIKSVLMTGARPEELTDEVRKAKFDAILHKPFFPAQVNRILCKLYEVGHAEYS